MAARPTATAVAEVGHTPGLKDLRRPGVSYAPPRSTSATATHPDRILAAITLDIDDITTA